MPHVVVKLWPGKSEQQKTRLAEEIAKDVMNLTQHYSAALCIKPVGGRPKAANRLAPSGGA